MARFFFDTAGPGGHYPDDVGSEHADAEAVRHIAKRALCEMAADDRHDGEAMSYTARVRDADGASIYEATLTLAGTKV